MNIRRLIKTALLPTLAIACAVHALAGTPATPAAPASPASPETLAKRALWNDPESAAVAVRELRALGPPGVAALLAIDAKDPKNGPRPIPEEEFARVLDQVCAQRDCASSKLYWYTDWDAALAAAKASGKPILSLRLLGRLDEDLSCANSRFFRTVLYADPEISRILRERFVLHWRSVRPVPRISIDFGDGRTLTGTLTGNSIHYVLDARGRLIDALPGLIGPGAFERELLALEAAARAAAKLGDEELAAASRRRHREAAGSLSTALTADLDAPLDPLGRHAGVRLVAPARLAAPQPTALEAARLAMSKSAVEMPILATLLPPAPGERWGEGVDWQAVARFHREDWRLDGAARFRLESKMGLAPGPDALRAARNFERLLAEDTARNTLGLRGVLHAWLAEEKGAVDLEAFNERVYAELFLTPSSDPWLGLRPDGVFTGLAPAPTAVAAGAPPIEGR
ncbi:MAG TPA: hypothetical protein VN783_02130 [Thermoanaerobaculia bacterium]|nr:hypothetical protein [Thermoanaerobaculia bacterium]